MKKISLLLVFVLIASALTLGASAVDLDNLKDAEVNEFAWLESSFGSLRAFDVDDAGTAAYCGQINSTGIVTKVDLKTGEDVWTYEASNGWAPKSVAVDEERGYVYIGLTNPDGADTKSYYAVVKAEDGEELVAPTEYTFGGDVQASFNGGFFGKSGDKYCFWNSVNYGAAQLVCFDVTDIKNIKLNTSWGEGGVADIAKLCGIDADHISYGAEYGQFDPADGSVWLCINKTGTKGSGVAHISADGKTLLGTVDGIEEAYSCEVTDKYVLVVDYNGTSSSLTVVDKASMAVKETGLLNSVDYTDAYTGVRYANGEIYIASQNNQTILTTAPIEAPIETEPETEPETKAPETNAPDTKAADTKAPETKTPDTKAADTADETKAEAPAKSNTGLIIGIVAAVVVIAAAVVIIVTKKKKA